MSIRLSVDRLVLRGFDPLEARPLVAALKAEIARSLTHSRLAVGPKGSVWRGPEPASRPLRTKAAVPVQKLGEGFAARIVERIRG